MLKLYVYGSFQQVRSSRRLEAECKRIVEVMWRIFGRPRFLMRGRRGTTTEIAIGVLGYNLKQALRALRPAGLIAALASCINGTRNNAPGTGRYLGPRNWAVLTWTATTRLLLLLRFGLRLWKVCRLRPLVVKHAYPANGSIDVFVDPDLSARKPVIDGFDEACRFSP